MDIIHPNSYLNIDLIYISIHFFNFQISTHCNCDFWIFYFHISTDCNYVFWVFYFQISTHCNCDFRTFEWTVYPDHVSDMTIKAWQPIIIQVSTNLHTYLSVGRGCHGRDCMIVGFTTTYAIRAYHH